MLAGLVELAIADAPHDRVGAGLLTRCWFADFGGEFGEVVIGCVEYVATFEFGTHGNLEQFRGGEIATFQLVVEVVWKVHLQTRHTPKHTHQMDQVIRGRQWTHVTHSYRRLGVREDLRGNPAR